MNSTDEYGGDASEEAAVQNKVRTSYNQSGLACIFLLNWMLRFKSFGPQVASNLIVD